MIFPGRQPDRLGRHDSRSALPGALAVLSQLKAWSVASDYRTGYNQLADTAVDAAADEIAGCQTIRHADGGNPTAATVAARTTAPGRGLTPGADHAPPMIY